MKRDRSAEFNLQVFSNKTVKRRGFREPHMKVLDWYGYRLLCAMRAFDATMPGDGYRYSQPATIHVLEYCPRENSWVTLLHGSQEK